MIFQMQEGYVALEGAWQDQSMNILTPLALKNKGVNLVIARDVLPSGMQLADYLTEQKKTFAQELASYRLVCDESQSVAEQPAHFLEFTWENHGSPLHQMVRVIQTPTGVLSMTATTPGAPDDAIRAQLLAVMQSFCPGLRPPKEEQTV